METRGRVRTDGDRGWAEKREVRSLAARGLHEQSSHSLLGATVSLDLNGRQRCSRTFRQAKRTTTGDVAWRTVPRRWKTKTAKSVQAAASRGGKGARSQNVALARRTGRPLPATLDVISPTRAYTRERGVIHQVAYQTVSNARRNILRTCSTRIVWNFHERYERE